MKRRSARLPSRRKGRPMPNKDLRFGTTNAGVVFGESTATGSTVINVLTTSGPTTKRTIADMEKAVYAHIRAIRALGRTSVNTVEIAEALGVQTARVSEAIKNLESKGVR